MVTLVHHAASVRTRNLNSVTDVRCKLSYTYDTYRHAVAGPLKGLPSNDRVIIIWIYNQIWMISMTRVPSIDRVSYDRVVEQLIEQLNMGRGFEELFNSIYDR